jgi:adenine deaminase
MKISGQVVDIHNRTVLPATITIEKGRIKRIERTKSARDVFICPGLIDAHIHIESSMITPGAFAIAAVRQGTTGVVSDPHEIANVLGISGIRFMINDSKLVPLRFNFGAPACVPATDFESSGAKLNHSDIEALLKLKEIKYLSEMMNFPGVIYGDAEVRRKIEVAKKFGKPIDGHAPGLKGELLKKYVAAGISTDHECSTLDEAKEKIALGMLQKRHINKIIARLISEGYDKFDVIRSATINPVTHYNLDAGLLREGDRADFILVDSLSEMNVIETWINGEKVFGSGNVLFNYKPGDGVNNFNCQPLKESDLRVKNKAGMIRVIEAYDGELLTREIRQAAGTGRYIYADNERDVLKIVVKDRYKDYAPALGFIKGFGIKRGAFASSIAHDSHNIICIGTNDKDMVNAINEIIRLKGGLSVADGIKCNSLQLNIGGIMTTRLCEEVADDYQNLNKIVQSLGCNMKAPFMTLSFMALLVIPDLKIGDRGLFDVKKFEPADLFVE